MSGGRLLRNLALMSTPGVNGATRPLCEVAAAAIEMTGAGIMIFEGDLPQGSVCTTGPVSAFIEDLQYALGEGPCVDAHVRGEPVIEADLAAPASPRWPAFGPPVVERGGRAVFGFPIRIGAARLGALNLYRSEPGPLSDDQHADALVMADVAARAILSFQADAPPGGLAVELEAGADFHPVVHQAAGMVSVQLDISVTEALVRLRGHAFAAEMPLAEVARAVVDRHLRFADPLPPAGA